jgi:hypothetical protein
MMDKMFYGLAYSVLAVLGLMVLEAILKGMDK